MNKRHRTAATKRALERYRNGESAYSAAKKEQIALTTIYRDPEYKRMRSERMANKDDAIIEAVKAIRKSDSGEWLKDCQTGVFSCSDGREKRQELMGLLDKLYEAAGV